jgi:hypothetical protein
MSKSKWLHVVLLELCNSVWTMTSLVCFLYFPHSIHICFKFPFFEFPHYTAFGWSCFLKKSEVSAWMVAHVFQCKLAIRWKLKMKACTRLRPSFYRILFQCEILLSLFKFCAINLLRSYKNTKVRQWPHRNYAGCALLCSSIGCGLVLCWLCFNNVVISDHTCVFGCGNAFEMPVLRFHDQPVGHWY